MSDYIVDSIGPSPEATTTLAVLADAMASRVVNRSKRVIAAEDSHSPHEGLAILGAYISIADRRVRQAVLDALLTIADADVP